MGGDFINKIEVFNISYQLPVIRLGGLNALTGN